MLSHSSAQNSSEDIVLRSAAASDVDWAAPLLFSTGPALFSYIFASPSDQAKEILQQAFLYPNHSFSYDYTQVVEVLTQPAGLMIGYPGFLKRQADEKVHQVMGRILPLLKLPKILVNLADLTRIKQDVAPEEYYILGLSVLPEFSRQGLGTYLLAEAEIQARSHNCHALCLDVTYTNTAARALFEKNGYQITCSKTTARFEQMTRSGGIHRMTKALK